MLSREDFYMIKQMRQQGAYIVDIATQIGCSERTVRRYLKYPEPPARKIRHKMVKLKPFMDYINMRLAENVWNSEVIFAEIKAMGYTGGRSCCVTTSSPNVKCVRQKEQLASKLSLDTSSSTTGAKLRWRLPGNGAKLTLRLIRWGAPAASMSSPHQNRMLSIPTNHWFAPSATSVVV